MVGKKHSEESKAKISNSNKGRILSIETIEKMKKPKSKETCLKMSRSKTGKKFSEVTREKMRQARLGKKFPRNNS